MRRLRPCGRGGRGRSKITEPGPSRRMEVSRPRPPRRPGGHGRIFAAGDPSGSQRPCQVFRVLRVTTRGRQYGLGRGSGDDSSVPVVMVIAIIVVLAAVVYVAMGRGGELSVERNDYVPLDLGPVSATDVALLRPPTGMWGYNMQVTDEVMEQVAESIRERDVRIVALEQLVTDLSRDHAPPVPLLASPYVGARHRRTPVGV